MFLDEVVDLLRRDSDVDLLAVLAVPPNDAVSCICWLRRFSSDDGDDLLFFISLDLQALKRKSFSLMLLTIPASSFDAFLLLILSLFKPLL